MGLGSSGFCSRSLRIVRLGQTLVKCKQVFDRTEHRLPFTCTDMLTTHKNYTHARTHIHPHTHRHTHTHTQTHTHTHTDTHTHTHRQTGMRGIQVFMSTYTHTYTTHTTHREYASTLHEPHILVCSTNAFGTSTHTVVLEDNVNPLKYSLKFCIHI